MLVDRKMAPPASTSRARTPTTRTKQPRHPSFTSQDRSILETKVLGLFTCSLPLKADIDMTTLMIYKFIRLRFTNEGNPTRERGKPNKRRISDMAIVRFRPYGLTADPFRDFGDIQSEMNRLFDSF